jgi:molybdate transport system substrate-binding protein
VQRRSFVTLAVLAAAARPRAAHASAARSASDVDEVVVFAAVSLSEAMQEIAEAYRVRSGTAVLVSFGGSGDLARQVRAGAPAQVFLSADALRVDELERAGLVRPSERADLLSNRLVVVAPAASKLVVRSAADLAALPRLALADPASVPAGAYARQWLERAGAWPELRDRVVPALDVRAALAAVASGNAAAGVVYATDAAISRRVRVVYEVPVREAPRIVYVAALLPRAPAAARAFFAYLRSAEASAAFRRSGFEPLTGR